MGKKTETSYSPGDRRADGAAVTKVEGERGNGFSRKDAADVAAAAVDAIGAAAPTDSQELRATWEKMYLLSRSLPAFQKP